MSTPFPPRCPWAQGGDYERYHDEEWGVPKRDERVLFELLNLEGAQAGLSWITILRKREGYRRAFAGWDPERVAAFGADDRTRLLADAGIVRNRAKVDAAISNAQALLALHATGRTLSAGWTGFAAFAWLARSARGSRFARFAGFRLR